MGSSIHVDVTVHLQKSHHSNNRHFKFCRTCSSLYLKVNDWRSQIANRGTNVSLWQHSQIWWKMWQTSSPCGALDEMWSELFDLRTTDYQAISMCHFPMSVSFRSGNAAWYSVTKGSLFFCAVLFFCASNIFLSENLIPERDSADVFCRRVLKFLMFSSKVNWEEFVLRSLNASPLIRPFMMPGGWYE